MKPQRARHLIRAVIIVLGGVALLASRPTKETVPSSLGATLRTAADTTIELAKGTTTDSGREFDAFAEWSTRYAEAATLAERQALETTGVALARARRAALAQHIQLDPERALELTIPPGMRRRLPAAVTELLEHQVKGRGDLAVMAALPEPGQECSVEPVWRVASVNGEEYRAYVYGRRLGEPHPFLPGPQERYVRCLENRSRRRTSRSSPRRGKKFTSSAAPATRWPSIRN
jgi:hypothetical protein